MENKTNNYDSLLDGYDSYMSGNNQEKKEEVKPEPIKVELKEEVKEEKKETPKKKIVFKKK